MDEKEKTQEESQSAGEKAQEATQTPQENAARVSDAPSKAGDKKEDPKPKSPIEEARELDASIKRGNAEMKKLVERNEQALGEARLEGKSFASRPIQEPKPLTDAEYAEALQKGLVNPMKEDGFI